MSDSFFILLPTLHGTSQIQYLNPKYFLLENLGHLMCRWGSTSSHRFETLAEEVRIPLISDPLVMILLVEDLD